ncbi:hypothetical protein HYO35_22425 [Vibrio parahaemolyticus]|nr:hypothetical protein [Vibrio parahaemolyticus]
MRKNALYFPYISVPNNQWTIKTLLYWDRLSSIVPMDYLHNPDALDPFMRSLVYEGLVEQVVPANHLYQIPRFEQSFIDFIEKRQPVLQRGSFSDQRGRIHHEKLGSTIHAEKLGEIPNYLIETGLAIESDSYGWYLVDKRVAKWFMAYLATCLGALDDVDAAPVTNQVGFASLISPQIYRNNKHKNKARDVVLEAILPTPSEEVTLDQLLRFKSDYGHLLPKLRLKVESHCAHIATIRDHEVRELMTNEFISNCRDDLKEIEDAMSPTWRHITFGKIIPLFGAGFTVNAIDANEDTLAYAGAALSLAGVAYDAIASIRSDRERAQNKPLAYIAHAHRNF